MKGWRDPSVTQAKWIYWSCLILGALISVVVSLVYGVPILLLFLVLCLSGCAGITKGYYNDV